MKENIISQAKDCDARLSEKQSTGLTRSHQVKCVPAHESHHINPANKPIQLCVYSHTPALMALVSRKVFIISCPNIFITTLWPFVLMSKLSCEFNSFCFSPVFTSLYIYLQTAAASTLSLRFAGHSFFSDRPSFPLITILVTPCTCFKRKNCICSPVTRIQNFRWCLTSTLVNVTNTLPASLKMFSSIYL